MAESLVSFLLGKIAVFIEEEKKLLTGVEGEFEFVKGELEQIQAFLRVAESMEETDPQAKVWINQVRQIAFDIEDLIDEFTLRMAHGHTNFIFEFIQSLKNVNYRHQIAHQIQSIKPRILDVSSRRERYKLTAPEQASSSSSPAIASSNLWHAQRGDALFLEEAELVGIDAPKRQLIQWLTVDDPALKIISVVGMGGLGKTTIAKKVYDNVKNQFETHVWITVSQSFQIQELLKDIVKKLYGQSNKLTPQDMERMSVLFDKLEKMSVDELKAVIHSFLEGNKYIVVLDDVWEIQALEAIKIAFPRNACGSRVMLTTRSMDVAKVGGQVYELKFLSVEESRALLCKKVFGTQECPEELQTVAAEILERCQGLPLAIVAISGLLARRGRSVIDWDMVKRSLPGELDGGKLQAVEKILSLSYYDLPFYLKACMLYISVFPEDYEMECTPLVRLWIAEGFVQGKERQTLEEVAEEYLYELINRSLIQVARRDEIGRIRTCRIHDILREVIISKAKDQKFVSIISDVQQNTGTLSHEKTARRLSFQNGSGNKVCRSNISKLRSLLVFSVNGFTLKLMRGDDIRLIRVLDLRKTGLRKLGDEVMKLYHLRYLCLRETDLRALPTSIGNLQQLETLDLKNTLVEVLPATIVKLQRLRHLLVRRDFHATQLTVLRRYSYDVVFGFRAIKGLGCLHSLQKLYCLDLDPDHQKNRKGIIEEIGRLSQLRKLGIRNLRFEDSKIMSSTIDKLSNIHSLQVYSYSSRKFFNYINEMIDLEAISSPSQFLQRLSLFGGLKKIPNWISSLRNLSKLILGCSELEKDEDLLEPIQSLPSLEYLGLHEVFEGVELCFKAQGFQNLKVLLVRRIKKLERLEVEKGAMPNLQELTMQSCLQLKKLPIGIEHLAQLRSLQIVNLSSDFFKTIDESGEGGEDRWKIKHIPQVKIERPV